MLSEISGFGVSLAMMINYCLMCAFNSFRKGRTNREGIAQAPVGLTTKCTASNLLAFDVPPLV